VLTVREEDQQDAPLSQFIPIKLSPTCFEHTSSSSGGYFCTRSIQYFSCICGCL